MMLSTVSAPRRVVSRRVWEAHKANHSKTKTPKSEPKEDEKPWPQSVLITGGVAAAIGVPYLTAWFLAINKPVRDVVTTAFPTLEEYLRPHFGYQEDMPWQEFREGAKPVYKLEDEDDAATRHQQVIIGRLSQEEVPVRVRILANDGVTATVSEMKRVPATTPASKSVLLSLMGMSGKETAGSGGSPSLAVDFADLDNDQEDGVVLSDGEEAQSMENVTNFATGMAKNTKSEGLNNQIYSSWFYQPSPETEQPSGGGTAQNAMSRTELEMSRLEYEVQQLEKQLRDPSSTRDMDDMQKELQQARSDLSGLRWRRRLGMA